MYEFKWNGTKRKGAEILWIHLSDITSALELLRKSAEHFLSEMVRLLYSRLPQFPLQEAKGSINYKVIQTTN